MTKRRNKSSRTVAGIGDCAGLSRGTYAEFSDLQARPAGRLTAATMRSIVRKMDKAEEAFDLQPAFNRTRS